MLKFKRDERKSSKREEERKEKKSEVKKEERKEKGEWKQSPSFLKSFIFIPFFTWSERVWRGMLPKEGRGGQFPYPSVF